MRIEILDRAIWLDKVLKAKQYIFDKRAKEDQEFEIQWRKRRFLPDRHHSEKPKFEDAVDSLYYNYPSQTHWGAMNVLDILELGLKTTETGSITMTGDEIAIIEAYQPLK